MTTYTREQITEAWKKANNGLAGSFPSHDWIVDFVEALGLTVEDPKPEPGIYLHDDGTVIEVYGETPTPVQAFHESSDWLAENRPNLTPARVVPAEPVDLTEEQVGELYDEARTYGNPDNTYWWAGVRQTLRGQITATVNAARRSV